MISRYYAQWSVLRAPVLLAAASDVATRSFMMPSLHLAQGHPACLIFFPATALAFHFLDSFASSSFPRPLTDGILWSLALRSFSLTLTLWWCPASGLCHSYVSNAQIYFLYLDLFPELRVLIPSRLLRVASRMSNRHFEQCRGGSYCFLVKFPRTLGNEKRYTLLDPTLDNIWVY